MADSYLVQLTNHRKFSLAVAERIVALIQNRPHIGNSSDGPFEGTVVGFSVDDGPFFEEAEGEGLEWTLPFSGKGTANIQGLSPDGNDLKEDIYLTFRGAVVVSFPYDTLNCKGFEAIANDVDIEEIRIEEVNGRSESLVSDPDV